VLPLGANTTLRVCLAMVASICSIWIDVLVAGLLRIVIPGADECFIATHVFCHVKFYYC
jgi:hypothetical protein